MTGVARSKLVRSIPMPSPDLMKVFIRAHASHFKNDQDMPWVVDEPYLSIHSVRINKLNKFVDFDSDRIQVRRGTGVECQETGRLKSQDSNIIEC